MIGTELNVAAIIIGGVVGLTKKNPLSASNQSFFKIVLGLATVFVGLRLTWISFEGHLIQILKQLGIVMLALILGNLFGKLFKLQKHSNRVGQFARDRMAAARPDNPNRYADGFKVCAALFCVAPLAVLGSVHDGLSGYYYPLLIKGVMDGMAVMSFVAMFGSGVILAALPVLLLQGTITLLCGFFLKPFLETHGLVDPVNATGGLLIFCVALLIFEVRKVHVADYLPSLIFAPLIAFWLGWS